MITKEQRAATITKFGGSIQNTGTPEVQVALLTDRILDLTKHFEKHHLDYHGQRGMMKLIGQRKSLLKYLASKDNARYTKLIAELGLRK